MARFLPGAPIEIVERTIGDWPLRYGAYDVDGLSVWGATARILSQLGAILRLTPTALSRAAPPGILAPMTRILIRAPKNPFEVDLRRSGRSTTDLIGDNSGNLIFLEARLQAPEHARRGRSRRTGFAPTRLGADASTSASTSTSSRSPTPSGRSFEPNLDRADTDVIERLTIPVVVLVSAAPGARLPYEPAQPRPIDDVGQAVRAGRARPVAVDRRPRRVHPGLPPTASASATSRSSAARRCSSTAPRLNVDASAARRSTATRGSGSTCSRDVKPMGADHHVPPRARTRTSSTSPRTATRSGCCCGATARARSADASPLPGPPLAPAAPRGPDAHVRRSVAVDRPPARDRTSCSGRGSTATSPRSWPGRRRTSSPTTRGRSSWPATSRSRIGSWPTSVPTPTPPSSTRRPTYGPLLDGHAGALPSVHRLSSSGTASATSSEPGEDPTAFDRRIAAIDVPAAGPASAGTPVRLHRTPRRDRQRRSCPPSVSARSVATGQVPPARGRDAQAGSPSVGSRRPDRSVRGASWPDRVLDGRRPPSRRGGGPTRDHLAIVGARELDDERAHLGMLGPGRVRDVGRPDGRLAGRDPGPLLADADPAAALDDDEPASCSGWRAARSARRGRRRARRRCRGRRTWMTWPVSPTDPVGPSGRRWPTPNRRISMGIERRDAVARLAPAALRWRCCAAAAAGAS